MLVYRFHFVLSIYALIYRYIILHLIDQQIQLMFTLKHELQPHYEHVLKLCYGKIKT